MARWMAAAMLLMVPILEAAAYSSARACAVAPCCASARSCPMHNAAGKCRLRSCGEHGVSLVQAPPAVTSPATTIAAAPTFTAVALAPDTTTTHIILPPDPPPPRARA